VTASSAILTVNVLRVFVDESGEFGNLLGIVDGEDVSSDQRQQVAAALGYSETVFVEDPDIGQVQIFTPAVELPFAGHPTVGTAWWLRRQGHGAARLLTRAGPVDVTHEETLTWIRARAGWTTPFEWHEMPDQQAVDRADPADYPGGPHYLWAWVDQATGRLRSRMFAAAFGIIEDEATGAAAISFTDLQERDLDITQGRGSRIYTRWEGEGWARLGGRVVSEPSRTIAAEPGR
jgi:predicted PhzF superfamily epimerase YddE/YHI9